MATFYGTDTDCTTDVPLISVTVQEPRRLIAQRLIRRLTTPRGGLAAVKGNPNGGWNVRQYVLKRVSPSTIGQAEQQVAAECLKDEEIQSAIVTFTYAAKKLSIQVQAMSSAGPFDLTLVLIASTDLGALVQALVTF
jgi:hypothetical protein